MAKTSTHFHLIQFSYGEQSEHDFNRSISEIHTNSQAYAEWKEIENTRDQLSSVSFRPSVNTVSNILNYSKSLVVQKGEKSGVHYELQLN